MTFKLWFGLALTLGLFGCNPPVYLQFEVDFNIMRGHWQGTATIGETRMMLKLNLTAKYINQSTYEIAGTATLNNTAHTVIGQGEVTNNQLLLPRHSYGTGHNAHIKMLDSSGKTVWHLWHYGSMGSANEGVINTNPRTYAGCITAKDPKVADAVYECGAVQLTQIP